MPLKITGLLLFLSAAQIFSLQAGATNEVEQLRRRVEQLEAENRALSNRITGLAITFANSQADTMSEIIKATVHEDVTVPNDGTFRAIQTDIGSLLLKVQDAKPFLDGFKITIAVGNPLGVKIGSAKIYAACGKKKVEVETTSIAPGDWTKAELVFTPATAEDVKNVTAHGDIRDLVMNLPQ